MKKILLGYFLTSLLVGIGFAAWRIIFMLRYYDPYMKEYAVKANSLLNVYGYALFFVVLLLATASFFFIRIGFLGSDHELSEISVSEHQISTFTSALIGFLFIAVFVFLSLSLGAMLYPSQYVLFRRMQLLAWLLLPFVGAYFILQAAEKERFVQAKKIFAFLPPVWCVIFLVVSYLNPSYLYNDFNHLLCNASLGALAFFFLYEAKARITGKTTAAYFVFSLISMVLCMAYVLPNFILLAYWELSPELNFIFEAVEIGAVIYIPCITLLLISSLKKSTSVEEFEYMDIQEYTEYTEYMESQQSETETQSQPEEEPVTDIPTEPETNEETLA